MTLASTPRRARLQRSGRRRRRRGLRRRAVPLRAANPRGSRGPTGPLRTPPGPRAPSPDPLKHTENPPRFDHLTSARRDRWLTAARYHPRYRYRTMGAPTSTGGEEQGETYTGFRGVT